MSAELPTEWQWVESRAEIQSQQDAAHEQILQRNRIGVPTASQSVMGAVCGSASAAACTQVATSQGAAQVMRKVLHGIPAATVGQRLNAATPSLQRGNNTFTRSDAQPAEPCHDVLRAIDSKAGAAHMFGRDACADDAVPLRSAEQATPARKLSAFLQTALQHAKQAAWRHRAVLLGLALAASAATAAVAASAVLGRPAPAHALRHGLPPLSAPASAVAGAAAAALSGLASPSRLPNGTQSALTHVTAQSFRQHALRPCSNCSCAPRAGSTLGGALSDPQFSQVIFASGPAVPVAIRTPRVNGMMLSLWQPSPLKRSALDELGFALLPRPADSASVHIPALPMLSTAARLRDAQPQLMLPARAADHAGTPSPAQASTLGHAVMLYEAAPPAAVRSRRNSALAAVPVRLPAAAVPRGAKHVRPRHPTAVARPIAPGETGSHRSGARHPSTAAHPIAVAHIEPQLPRVGKSPATQKSMGPALPVIARQLSLSSAMPPLKAQVPALPAGRVHAETAPQQLMHAPGSCLELYKGTAQRPRLPQPLEEVLLQSPARDDVRWWWLPAAPRPAGPADLVAMQALAA